MNRLALIGISVVTALTASACSGKVSPSTSTQEDASAAPPPTVAAGTVSVNGFTHALNGSALGGVNVCLEQGIGLTGGPGPCVTSGHDGSFAVSGAMPNSSATLTFRHASFQPLLHPILTEASDITLEPADSTLLPDTGMFMGIPVDAAKGQVPFEVKPLAPGRVPKVSATATVLDPLFGFNNPALPPVYVDESGSVTAGASAGTAGGFANLTPGLYGLRFDFGAPCTAVAGMNHYTMNSTQGLKSGEAILYVVVRGGYVQVPVDVGCFDESTWGPALPGQGGVTPPAHP